MPEQLLIHSLSEFSCLSLPILDTINATKICEIGSEHGGNTKVLGEWCEAHTACSVTCIDPGPSELFIEWVKNRDQFQHIKEISLTAIPSVGSQHAWFIDGDHNWYTVYHELELIHKNQQDEPTVLFIHDVGWPCGFRDFYYTPDNIPDEFRHNYSWSLGVTLDNRKTIQGGFRGCDSFAVALEEGGEKNGVMTAVKDFLKSYPDNYQMYVIPAIFGLCVLVSASHPQRNKIKKILSMYDKNSLLEKLERNRLANYLKVIEWQDMKK